MRRIFIAICLGVLTFSVLILSNAIPTTDVFVMADYFIENAYKETGAPNAVTSIYLFYRYYDTLFEALMLLFSIIGVIYMSVHAEGEEYDQ